MSIQYIEQLLATARRKNQIDQGSSKTISSEKACSEKVNSWSNTSQTYLNEIKLELEEVAEELAHQPFRQPYLEQELGDVLWDYLNLLIALEQEQKIDISKVFQRASNKYQQRVDAIENGQSWNEIKQVQKQALRKELELKLERTS